MGMNWDKVRLMRKGYAQGMTQVQLSREFNLSVVQVGKIVNNLAWRQENIPRDEMTKEEQYRDICKRFKKDTGQDYTTPYDEWLSITRKQTEINAKLDGRLETAPESEWGRQPFGKGRR